MKVLCVLDPLVAGANVGEKSYRFDGEAGGGVGGGSVRAWFAHMAAALRRTAWLVQTAGCLNE